MFNIVLHEPRMPGNVGTIGRTAVALKCKLHLIKPYGFGDITEKEVRRAGLDYWKDLELFEYENIEDFWVKNPFSSRHFFATTKTTQPYFEAKFELIMHLQTHMNHWQQLLRHQVWGIQLPYLSILERLQRIMIS